MRWRSSWAATGSSGHVVGGLAFGTLVPARDRDPTLDFDAQSGEFLPLVVWFLFGAAMLPALENVTWQTVAFAVLALTVARLVPVALVPIGCRFTPVTVAFMGWFGPRRTASRRRRSRDATARASPRWPRPHPNRYRSRRSGDGPRRSNMPPHPRWS
jgi:hypothetical protein